MPEEILRHPNYFRRYAGLGFLFSFAFALIGAIMSVYIRSLGYSDSAVSFLSVFYPLALIFLSPIIGTWSDRSSRKKVIHCGVLAFILALALYLLDNFVLAIILGKILEAAAVSAVLLVVLARIEDDLGDRDRGRQTGKYLSFKGLGMMAAPLIAGFLAQSLGIRAPFYLALLISLLLFAVLFFLREPPEAGKLKPAQVRPVWNILVEIKEFLRESKLRSMAILGFTMHAAQIIRLVFIPLLIVEVMDRPVSYVGIAVFVYGIGYLFQVFFGKLGDRFGPERTVLTATAVYAIGTLLLFLAGSYAVLLIVLLLLSLSGAAWNVSAWNLMSRIAEGLKKEGQMVTCYMSLAKIGGVVMSLLAGIIVIYTSINFLFLVSGSLILLGVIIASRYLLVKTAI